MKTITSLRIGLRARILSLAILPIFGLIAALAIEHAASQRSADADLSYDVQREFVAVAIKLRTEVSAMRISADAFRAMKDKGSEAAFRESGERASRTINQLRAGADGEAGKAHAAVETTFNAFIEAFGTFVQAADRAGRSNSDGLLGAVNFASVKLRGQSEMLESEFGVWGGTFQATLHQLLLVERDFRVHQSNALLNNFEQLADNLARTIAIASLKPNVRADISQALDDYRRHFSDWTDGVQFGVTTFNQLAAHYINLGREIEALQASFEAGMRKARTEQGHIGKEQRLWVIGAFATVVAVSALLALVIGIGISRDARRLSAATLRLATGDTGAEMPRLGRKDEIGAMGDALIKLRDGAIERQRLEAAQSTASEERLKRAQGIETAIRAFEAGISQSLGSLRDAAAAMESVSGELDRAATQSEAQAVAAAGDTDKASSEIESAAVAAQQLSGSVEEVAAQATRSDEAAAGALAQADTARKVMAEMMAQADRVGEVVGVISAIAAQTNLLALNATIEAARAGEAGRGFAVVAAEVKDLSAQTGQATGEIAGQIGAIREASRGVVEAVDSMHVTIAEVSQIAGSVAAAVEEQATSLSGLSRNIVLASEGALRGANGIRTVQAAVTDTMRNAARVRGISLQVGEDAQKLSDKVIWFLDEVRAS
jgi:methyl-accepting chemotaxis protein